MNTKKVQVAGKLITCDGSVYYLLTPHPVAPDWEGDTGKRFVAVPVVQDADVLPQARHVVTTVYTIDYGEAGKKIEIEVPEQCDLSSIHWEEDEWINSLPDGERVNALLAIHDYLKNKKK